MSAGKASDVFVGPPAAARPGALLRSRPAALSGSRPKASGSAGGYLLPRRQLFVRSQQPWINDLSSIPKFDKMPAPLQDADAARPRCSASTGQLAWCGRGTRYRRSGTQPPRCTRRGAVAIDPMAQRFGAARVDRRLSSRCGFWAIFRRRNYQGSHRAVVVEPPSLRPSYDSSGSFASVFRLSTAGPNSVAIQFRRTG